MSSWMTQHLLQFGGSIGEDPVLHCQRFHTICSHMKPKNETLEEFKIKCFKLSLTDYATVWYYSSTASCAGCYEDLRAQFLEEFSPPSLRHDTRERIIGLQQSRDETLDEYYTYFDTIVSRCPHHGFTNVFLLQKFLCGMRPAERSRINDAAGGSAMNLTMTELWDLIDDLAEATKRRPMLQLDGRGQLVETNLEGYGKHVTEAMMDGSGTEEELTWDITPEPSENSESETELVWDEERLSWEGTTYPPEEIPNAIDELSETYLTLATRGTEEINRNQVLTDRVTETEPALITKTSQLFPLINMRIAAHEKDVINGEFEGRMKGRPEQNNPLKEHSTTTTRQGSPKLRRAAPVVKRLTPFQRYLRKKPPEQGELDPSTSGHKKPGRVQAKINARNTGKFDLGRPWDPDPT